MQKKVKMGKKRTEVSEAKLTVVKKLIDSFKNYKTIMVVSIKGLPSKQFQDIKKKLRDKARITISKKSLVRRAFEESKIDGLAQLESFVEENCAILYSNQDAFLISGILAKEKSPQKAKSGQEAPIDIEVKAGPTGLVPGPDISALSAVGLAPKVEGGKISVMQDKVIAKKGQVITDAVASIMAKLDIIPFEVGLEPIAAYMEGKVYDDIKIDIEGTIKDLEEKYSRALAFAVEISYLNEQTLDFILAKASLHANAVESLINNDSQTQTTQNDETKQEESSDSN